MPESMIDYVAIAALVVLLLLAAGCWIALGRLRAIASATRSAGDQAATFVRDLAIMASRLEHAERDLKLALADARRDQDEGAQALRREVGERLVQFTGTTQQQLRDFAEGLGQLRSTSEQRLAAVRETVEQRLDLLRSDNAQKLEQMRATVDEKLQSTLEARLGESFRLVSDRLDQVHKGLGEMQSLAQGVGDLKRVLANVKSRGTWGEMQLGALLADLLTPQQYGTNVETVPGTNRRVEFAIRVPSHADEPPCCIPVDAKFPVEEWERLQAALDRADGDAADAARKALAHFARTQARKIRDSYVCPPHTSEFSFLFLPTESLYAELMSHAGLADELQREYRVTLAGPSNFLAFLNVVQMGFQRVAIEQRSAEVWRLLGAVRTEFGKFGQVIARAQKKLQEASNTLDEARGKTTTIERKLRGVEALPDADAARLLAAPAPFVLEPDEQPIDEK
jgi:DNA recombination protein RmuC